MVSLTVNGKLRSVDADLRTPLLWVLREQIGLTGTKYGCGAGLCGACAVHFNGALVRSCQVPLEAAQGARVTTIEGLSQDGDHPVQQAWMAENVPQCGYCQSGQIMAAVDLLARHPNPNDTQIDEAMSHVCRCGTYGRIRKAIHRAARA